MKVMHVAAGRMFGGIETMLCALAGVTGSATSSTFVLSHPGRLADELRGAGADVRVLGPMRASRLWTVWQKRRALQALLAETAPTAVVFHGPWAYALLSGAVAGRSAKRVLWA